MKPTVYPSIDVRGGGTVRLREGDYAQETRYAQSPADLARRYAKAGAEWLHLVDLDGARDGGHRLAALLGEIRDTTTLRVQTGGGIRSTRDIDDLLDAGAHRVVVGSVAAVDPPCVAAWMARFGRERICVALDARRDADGVARVPAYGWTAAEAPAFEALLAFYSEAGLQHLLCTAIERDGSFRGPDLEFYAAIRAAAPGVLLQASGGIRDTDDVRAAFAIGCSGVVIGKALLEARVTLEEALEW